MELLYTDSQLVVCLKPCGVLSEDKGDGSLPALLRETVGGEIAVVHRLDRPVGGVMVYARNARAAGALTRSLHEGGEKVYLAVVAGDPGACGTYEDLLFHDAHANKTYVVRRMRKGVREAKLSFERLGTADKDGQTISLVRATLGTGRTHQIRTQFAARKMPLVGDRRYGSRIESETLALWSAQLSFDHPTEKRRMTFRHAPPDVFPFSLFSVNIKE